MDPAKMKVVDLRAELGALGLDTKGNKAALVERLKKALEAKTGKEIADTTILDTSTEDADEPPTPRRAGPAARTRRRSSSTRMASTPVKVARTQSPEPIVEEPKQPEPVKEPSPEPVSKPDPEPVQETEPEPVPAPVPVPVPAPVERDRTPEPEVKPQVQDSEMYSIDDGHLEFNVQWEEEENQRSPIPHEIPPSPAMYVECVDSGNNTLSTSGCQCNDQRSIDEDDSFSAPSNVNRKRHLREDEKSQSPVPEVKKDVDEPMDTQEKPEEEKTEKPAEGEQKMEEDAEKTDNTQGRQRELTEEEEWEQLNERLLVKEQERKERERKQAEEDAKRLEELSNDPVKLQRLKRKHEKKARWSNFYKAVEITNEVLTPPAEDVNLNKGKKVEAVDTKVAEPEIDDNKMTLSWYDSDLNQYLETPELTSVVPLSEGAFAHAWAGARASHGVAPGAGRVCYEVRVGAVVTTTESTEKEVISNGLRIGWSTDDSTLHLGEGELSFGYESSGRAVHNGEFKEYGKAFQEKDVIGAYLDLESNPCKISYTLNGAELGVAYEFDPSALGDKALFPHVLTKNMCYRVNFGDDQYSMLTKTKIVRKRIEIPIEQVLEEKRKREEEIQRQKEEAARRERERRDREKREREERQRKKREEREKQEREKKEKEAAEKKAAEAEAEKETAGEVTPMEGTEEPKENGDKPEEVTVKEEPTKDDAKDETKDETKEEVKEADDKVKEEPAPEGEIPEMTEEQVLKGHTLDKRIKFVTRFTVEQEIDGPEACLLPGYVFIARAELAPGPRRPDSLAECEVILMVGMPGSGKTYWATQHMAAHPERRYNVLSTGALFDRMQVDCKPFRAACEGRWDAMLSKGAKCVLKLLEFAHGRRRNYILDQRRKLREFEGYRRVAVVVVPSAAEHEARRARREVDGKEVPDGAVVDMKANFTLPEKCSWIDEVIYPELPEEEAKKVLEEFHKEAKAAGVVREKEKRERSDTRDAPPAKRQRSADRRHPRDDRRKDFGRDREDRWGGGGGGGGGGNSRWGPARGGGGRWGGPRDRPPPPGRFDRPWGPPRDNNGGGLGGGGGGFNRERDGFRGGRGGGRGGFNDRPGDRPRPDRFPRDHAQLDKRPHQEGGMGGWQRGGGGQGGGQGGAPGGARGRPAPGGAPRTNPPPASRPPNKDGQQGQGQGQGQQNQAGQGWNQWANSGWGNWAGWNQAQGQNQNQAAGWGNWNNWNNWNAQQQQAGNKGAQGQQATQQQWQQWYQWQQWQQQHGWPGYGQQQQQGGTGTGTAAATAAAGGGAADPQAWAQYYQNYNANAAANNTAVEKK